MLLDERLMADIACIDPVYADGELGFLNLGQNFLTCFFRWKPVKRDCNGALVYEKIPVASIVQPMASLAHPNGRRAAILRAQGAPSYRTPWAWEAELH